MGQGGGNAQPSPGDPSPAPAQRSRCPWVIPYLRSRTRSRGRHSSSSGATEVPSAPRERCGAGAAPGHTELFPTLAEASVKSLLKPQVRDCFSCPSSGAVPPPHPQLHTEVLMSTNCSVGARRGQSDGGLSPASVPSGFPRALGALRAGALGTGAEGAASRTHPALCEPRLALPRSSARGDILSVPCVPCVPKRSGSSSWEGARTGTRAQGFH